ncbi:hypothetical protein CKA32_006471 [Geitlerinema sp. FC II]|nr:hypothetical protein CKA32_006471 [Geitlerinema sp. FC II]
MGGCGEDLLKPSLSEMDSVLRWVSPHPSSVTLGMKSSIAAVVEESRRGFEKYFDLNSTIIQLQFVGRLYLFLIGSHPGLTDRFNRRESGASHFCKNISFGWQNSRLAFPV